MTPLVRSTPDAYLGLDDATPEAWGAWHRAMLDERASIRARAGLDDSFYDDPSTAWSDLSFRQFFLFMYDASFFDRHEDRYLTRELVARLRRLYGRIDSVLLWHAYPRLGFDERTQFDFYRDMPGGLLRLRSDVVDVFHDEGIRVFVDYNPWATGTFDELAAIVHALAADGVMLDTMTNLPDDLARAVKKIGVVFAPELRPRDEELRVVRQSWAQWLDVGDASTPSIHRHRWIEPRHRQLTIARWDTSRRKDIVYSFFSGSGLILWDNVFGCWNPYSRDDRKLIAETGAVLDAYGDLIAHGEWLPLVPTGTSGLDANVWTKDGKKLVLLRNRTDEPKAYRAEDAGLVFWGEHREAQRGDAIVVEPGGTQALVNDGDRTVLERFDRASREADFDPPGYGERTPRAKKTVVAAALLDDGEPFTMKIRHERRESGCIGHEWGWFYKDVIEHEIETKLRPFTMRPSPVTNAEYVAFVKASGYRPKDGARFLAHLPRDLVVPEHLAGEPVTHVSVDDARAFAAWEGARLPTEAEWQHAGLSVDEWELTESEHFDGHTRFLFLRGGSPLPERDSEWLPERGTRPIDSHVKYLLLADGLDRASTITFRTVRS
jgi:hypothetical protein